MRPKKWLGEMTFVEYDAGIAEFLPEMENLTTHARVTVIGGRTMIEDQIHEDVLRRLSLQEYVDEGEWLEAGRTVTRAEEDFKERKRL